MPVSVAIVDYGTGNLASLDQAFRAIGANPFLASTPDQLRRADALVLPGVGHFGPASQALTSSGLREALITLIGSGFPCLAICLGFHLLTHASEEAPDLPGLGLLDLYTSRIKPINTRLYKVPHLGWNTLSSTEPPPLLLAEIEPERQLFYFANAYAIAAPEVTPNPVALYFHERPWLAIVQHGSIHAVQFHPEKSRSQGLQLLRNFLRIATC